MNKRIRKKKDRQRLAWAVSGLVDGYQRRVAAQEKRCKELSEEYGLCIVPVADAPLHNPPIIAETPELAMQQQQYWRELNAFVRRCERLYAQNRERRADL